jgi:hypothetical protein
VRLDLILICTRCDNTCNQRQQVSTASAMNGYPPPPPASAWRAATAADGREYYYNATTNITTWDKPEELKDDVEVCVEITSLGL